MTNPRYPPGMTEADLERWWGDGEEEEVETDPDWLNDDDD